MQLSRHFLYNVIDIFVQDCFALVENEEILNKRASDKNVCPQSYYESLTIFSLYITKHYPFSYY